MTLTGYERYCSEIVTQTELPAVTIDGADMPVPAPVPVPG